MGFVDKRHSRMQGQWFLWSQAAGRATFFGQVQKKANEKCPGRLSDLGKCHLAQDVDIHAGLMFIVIKLMNE